MRHFIVSCLAIICAIASYFAIQPITPAYAVKVPNWKPLELACLPNRAVRWKPGLTEKQQAPCHCPPIEYCPDPNKTYKDRADFLDGEARDSMNGTPMPPNMILRCCNMPICPKGTTLAGQILPEDGKCNILCPAGSQLAGEPLPANKNCNPLCPSGTHLAGRPVPPDGNCDPNITCPPNQLPVNGKCEPKVCPPGSTLAGKPIPANGNCNPTIAQTCNGTTTIAVIGCEPGSSGENCIPIMATICCEGFMCGDQSCITAQTKVTLADGSIKPAHKIAVGDVLAGPEGGSTVKATNRYRTANRLLYSINKGALTVSGNHPILTNKGYTVVSEPAFKRFVGKPGYAPAHLQTGDIIIAEKQSIVVENIQAIFYREPVSTYNFITDDQKPFFAGGMALKPVKDIDFKY